MDIQTKYRLIEKLVNTNNEEVLQQVKAILEGDGSDFWDDTSDEEKKAIETVIKQLNEGNSFSYEQVRAEVKQKFGI